jgi:hypothetical protein
VTTDFTIDPATAGMLPGGYTQTGLAYDISTTAAYTGPVNICFHLPAISDPNIFVRLKVLHNEGGTLVDRTTGKDFPSRILCASVSSLSRFVIAQGATPTAITLASFTATAHNDGQVLLEWKTGYEVDNLGFNIYRDEAGRRTLVNPSLLAGSALLAGARTVLFAGQSYVWADMLTGDPATRYWLEDIDLNGTSTFNGPYAISDSAPKKLRSNLS